MIGNRLLALAVRRERLRVRADGQRSTIAASVRGLETPIRIADRALGGVRWLKLNPAAGVAALVAFVLVRPRNAASLAQGGLRLWAAWRALRAPRTRVAWALLPRMLDIYRGLRGRR
ncbi:MAG: YqjK-like family protein [Burkholderiales bacterium]|nr:YqjK-like family protein [Burkholderiales bacterium]